MERVSIVHGKCPVIFVAPHGFDDTHTSVIAKNAALKIGANSISNNGWQRDENVDIMNDRANCNSIKHCNHDVVKDEFMDPLNQIATHISQRHPKCYVFHIHGCSDQIRNKTGHLIGVILGWGDGKKKRVCCPQRERDLFCFLAEQNLMSSANCLPAQAGEGSQYAAWNYDNLLQSWRTWQNVCALQLEFVSSLRKTKSMAKATGDLLGSIVGDFLESDKLKKSAPSSYSYLRLNI